MCSTKNKTKKKTVKKCKSKRNPWDITIYLVIEQLVYGSAEDDTILGFCQTEKDALAMAESLERDNPDNHYEVRSVLRLW